MRGLGVALFFVGLIGIGAFGPLAWSADPDPDAVALEERLRQTTVTLQIEKQTVGEVLTLLALQTGINHVIDPRIDADVRELEVTNLFVEDLPMNVVLNLVVLNLVAAAAGEEAIWRAKGNVVVLTTRELVPRRLTVRFYPVAFFTTPRAAFIPPRVGLLGSRDERDVPDAYADRLPFGSADELIELVKSGVSPRYWEETEGADMRTDGEHRLVVKASPAIHTAIHRYLAGLAALTPDAVLVEIFAIAGADESSDPASAAAVISDAEVGGLLSGSRAGPALRLAVRAGASSTTFAGTRRRVVTGHEPDESGARVPQDPAVASLETGMAARVRVLPGPVGSSMLLKLDVAVAEPRRVRTPKSAPEAPITLMEREIMRRRSTMLVASGRWQWVEGRDGGADAGRWGFLVRATRTAPGEAQEAATGAYEVPRPSAPGDAPPFRERRIEQIQWDHVSLDEALSFLRNATKLNYYVTPRLRAEVFDEVVISLTLKSPALGTVLDLITEPYALTWKAKDGLVVLDVKDDERREMALRYFDLRDLVEHLAPARIEASPDQDPDEGRVETRPLYEPDHLVDLMRESIGHYDQWEHPACIEARNGILIVRNTNPILDAVGRMLDGLRRSRQLVETTIEQLEMGDALARALLGLPDDAALLLEAEDLARLGEALQTGGAVRLSRERMITLDGTGETRDTGTAIPHVADVEIREGKPLRRIETLLSGTRTDLRATPVHPGDRIGLELVLKRAVLTAMGTVESPRGPIEIPTVAAWDVSTGLRIPDGRTAVVAASRADGRWRILLVTPRRVPLGG